MRAMLATAALMTLAAGSVHGQCTLMRYGMPDFDQKRDALANDGKMFCVPTSFTNIRGYIANHGYGAMMGGPRNWQSQGNYNYVTARINVMGNYMDTDPYGGTGGNAARDGWNDFIDDSHEDKFVLDSWSGYCPPAWIYVLFNTGMTNICYGYYKQSGSQWYRDGGHCVTLVGLRDLCSSFNEPTLRIRNPSSDDGDLDVQSPFSTEQTKTDAQSFNLNGETVTRLRLTDFGVGSSTRRYMDKLYAVQPLISLTGSVTSISSIFIHRPVLLFTTSGASGNSSGPGAFSIVSDIALHPMGVEAYVVSSEAFTQTKNLYKVDLATGDWNLLLPAVSTAQVRVTTSRHGDVFLSSGGLVRKYDVSGPTPTLLKSVTSPYGIADLEYDDALDEVVALTTNERMLRLAPDSLAALADQPLPGGVAVVGDGSVVPNPKAPGHWYIASTGSPTIFEVTPIAGSTRLRTNAAISLPAGTEPLSMKAMDSGDIVFIDDKTKTIMEYKRSTSATGAPIWVPDPDSDLSGRPGTRALVVLRSRSNFDERVMTLREWQDDMYEPEGAVSIPDCDPDLNMDGSVDILDFLAFFNSYDPCQSKPGPCGIDGVNADYNFDGTVDILDFLDFMDAFGDGCP